MFPGGDVSSLNTLPTPFIVFGVFTQCLEPFIFKN